MIIENITFGKLDKAIDKLNEKYGGNIRWNRTPELYRGYNSIRCTIRVCDCRGKGAKHGLIKQHTISACWHAHGDFFDCILNVEPKAIIIVAGIGINLASKQMKIFKDNSGNIINNWQDSQAGSIAHPIMYSKMCNCADWRKGINHENNTKTKKSCLW